MVKDNVWYLKQFTALENEIINYFKSRGIWKTVIWNDNEYLDPRNPKEIREKYFQHSYFEVPATIYNRIYTHLFAFVEMQSRRSPWSSLIYDQKNIHDYLDVFNKMLSFTYKNLIENEISLVVMNRAPHFGGELLLYLLAKELKIKTLIFEPSLFPNKYFYFWEVEDYGSFNTSRKLYEAEVEPIPREYEKDLFYMKALEKKPTVQQHLRKKFYKEIRFIKESCTHSGWEQSLQRYALRSRYERNKKKYTTDKIDFNIPYVYFALHLQPEKTTSSFGGKYSDQLLAIERLSSKLPEGWMIYVKENPKQQYMMRGEWFYDRLNSIPNTKLVEAHTHELLHHSQFAATITGTVGWEAITGGKNVLVFGWGVWYKNFPGVFTFDDDFDIKEILDYHIDHSELEEEVANLKSRMCNGIIYNRYRATYPEYNASENINTVIENFNKILYPELTDKIGT